MGSAKRRKHCVRQVLRILRFLREKLTFNKEGKVVYNGYLSNRPWIFAYHPRKFLE